MNGPVALLKRMAAAAHDKYTTAAGTVFLANRLHCLPLTPAAHLKEWSQVRWRGGRRCC